MKIIQAPLYVSDDGRDFKSADECIAYEKFTKIRDLLHKKVPYGSPSAAQVVSFILDNWNDIKQVME